MQTREAIKRVKGSPNVSGNPILVALVPVVIEIAMNLLSGCKAGEQEALNAMSNPTEVQYRRMVAATRKRLKDEGRPATLAEVRAVVNAACDSCRDCTPAERLGFLARCYDSV